jgi:hypothetical protein
MLRVFASRAGQALAQQASAAVTVKAAPLMVSNPSYPLCLLNVNRNEKTPT